MHIVIATPLFPPDVEESAVYVKALAQQLARTHTVSVVCFTPIPESIPLVTIHSIPKGLSHISRIRTFSKTLHVVSKDADILVIENGPSTEVAALLCWIKKPAHTIVFDVSDTRAVTAQTKSLFKQILAYAVSKAATVVIDEKLLDRPERFPFSNPPLALFAAYEESIALRASAICAKKM